MKFNINVIANIIGILLMINGFLMLTAVPFGIYHMESTWKGMLVSSFINSAVGFLLYYRTKDNKNKDLRRRDGYLIVTSSWVFMCLFGMLPYIITNQIPNLSNAFFETVSGYTTTGATILDDIESLDHSILYWRSLTPMDRRNGNYSFGCSNSSFFRYRRYAIICCWGTRFFFR